MPKKIFRRRFKKRFRRFKKKGFNPLSLRISNNSRPYINEVTCYIDLNNSELIDNTIVVSVPFHFPVYQNFNYTSNTGPALWRQWPNQPTFFDKFITIFDEYKVMKLMVKFLPNFVETVQSPDTVDNPNLIYMYHDVDSSDPVLLEDYYLNQGIIPRTFSRGNPVQRILKRNRSDPWCNVQVIGEAPGAATTSTTNLFLTIYRSLKVVIPNIPHGYTIGRLYATWVVMWKGFQTAI